MSVKVYAVISRKGDDIQTVEQVSGSYCSMDGACGDTRGDLYNNIVSQFGACQVHELRFVSSRPIELVDDDDDDDDCLYYSGGADITDNFR